MPLQPTNLLRSVKEKAGADTRFLLRNYDACERETRRAAANSTVQAQSPEAAQECVWRADALCGRHVFQPAYAQESAHSANQRQGRYPSAEYAAHALPRPPLARGPNR